MEKVVSVQRAVAQEGVFLLRRDGVQSENFPARENPVFVVQIEGRSPFNVERDQNLHVGEESARAWVGQRGAVDGNGRGRFGWVWEGGGECSGRCKGFGAGCDASQERWRVYGEGLYGFISVSSFLLCSTAPPIRQQQGESTYQPAKIPPTAS